MDPGLLKWLPWAEAKDRPRVVAGTRILTTALPRQRWLRRNEPLLIGVAAVVLFFVVWHVVAVL
ncbi:MAG TPA: hypothetical protein VFA01_06015, partial [Candidatus Dormibacteraeota bacterium]|nr:hypothetical protein [Candidatus Dormibacteraeota bacterium]